MANPRKTLDEVAREKGNYRIWDAQIVDTQGNGIPASSLATLTLKLHLDDVAATVINTVDGVNILNSGRGTVDSSGNLVIELVPADQVILDNTLLEEVHIALVEWTYNGGNSSGVQEFAFRVRNFARRS